MKLAANLCDMKGWRHHPGGETGGLGSQAAVPGVLRGLLRAPHIPRAPLVPGVRPPPVRRALPQPRLAHARVRADGARQGYARPQQRQGCPAGEHAASDVDTHVMT